MTRYVVQLNSILTRDMACQGANPQHILIKGINPNYRSVDFTTSMISVVDIDGVRGKYITSHCSL